MKKMKTGVAWQFDIFLYVSLAMIVGGFYLWSAPCGLVVAGFFLLGLTILFLLE